MESGGRGRIEVWIGGMRPAYQFLLNSGFCPAPVYRQNFRVAGKPRFGCHRRITGMWCGYPNFTGEEDLRERWNCSGTDEKEKEKRPAFAGGPQARRISDQKVTRAPN